jgi:hypothetical protein
MGVSNDRVAFTAREPRRLAVSERSAERGNPNRPRSTAFVAGTANG